MPIPGGADAVGWYPVSGGYGAAPAGGMLGIGGGTFMSGSG